MSSHLRFQYEGRGFGSARMAGMNPVNTNGANEVDTYADDQNRESGTR
jgi:hypothetical protein